MSHGPDPSGSDMYGELLRQQDLWSKERDELRSQKAALESQLAETEQSFNTVTRICAEVLAERDTAQTKLAEARNIVDLYFAPLGAAKAVEWGFIAVNGEFSAEKALRVIRKAIEDAGALRAKPEAGGGNQ